MSTSRSGGSRTSSPFSKICFLVYKILVAVGGNFVASCLRRAAHSYGCIERLHPGRRDLEGMHVKLQGGLERCYAT